MRQFRKTPIRCKILCSSKAASLSPVNRMWGVAIKLNLATMDTQSHASGNNLTREWKYKFLFWSMKNRVVKQLFFVVVVFFNFKSMLKLCYCQDSLGASNVGFRPQRGRKGSRFTQAKLVSILQLATETTESRKTGAGRVFCPPHPCQMSRKILTVTSNKTDLLTKNNMTDCREYYKLM